MGNNFNKIYNSIQIIWKQPTYTTYIGNFGFLLLERFYYGPQ